MTLSSLLIVHMKLLHVCDWSLSSAPTEFTFISMLCSHVGYSSVCQLCCVCTRHWRGISLCAELPIAFYSPSPVPLLSSSHCRPLVLNHWRPCVCCRWHFDELRFNGARCVCVCVTSLLSDNTTVCLCCCFFVMIEETDGHHENISSLRSP